MYPCEKCDALLSESTTASPHDGLSGGVTGGHHGGILERYTCDQCGIAWERLKSTGAEQTWQMMIAYG